MPNRNVLVTFWGEHPETRVSLERWHKIVRAAQWTSTDEVQKAAPKAKVLNRTCHGDGPQGGCGSRVCEEDAKDSARRD
jgi:hypothetical protein